MHYAYILLSQKSHIFYFGSTKDIKKRFDEHNAGKSFATKPHIPFKLVWYCAFQTTKEAEDFEKYLKSGAGKAFAYKRLVSVALAKDFSHGRRSSPKSKTKDTKVIRSLTKDT